MKNEEALICYASGDSRNQHSILCDHDIIDRLVNRFPDRSSTQLRRHPGSSSVILAELWASLYDLHVSYPAESVEEQQEGWALTPARKQLAEN